MSNKMDQFSYKDGYDTDNPHKINFKKPGMCWPVAGMHLVSKLPNNYQPVSLTSIFC